MSTRPMAMVAFDDSTFPDNATLQAEIAALWPDAAPATESIADGTEAMIMVDGLPIVIMRVGQPIPATALADSIAASYWWPEAGQALGGHHAHMIVATLHEPENHADRLAAVRAVTAVAAAASGSEACRAVTWPHGNLAFEPAFFRAEAGAKLYADMPPFSLWVGLHVFRGDGNLMGVGSTGLALFVDREVELMPSPLPPPVAVDRAAGLTAFLIKNGPVIGDGDSVGVDDSERITIHFQRSALRVGMPIYAAVPGPVGRA